jgi:hypothetical protein
MAQMDILGSIGSALTFGDLIKQRRKQRQLEQAQLQASQNFIPGSQESFNQQQQQLSQNLFQVDPSTGAQFEQQRLSGLNDQALKQQKLTQEAMKTLNLSNTANLSNLKATQAVREAQIEMLANINTPEQFEFLKATTKDVMAWPEGDLESVKNEIGTDFNTIKKFNEKSKIEELIKQEKSKTKQESAKVDTEINRANKLKKETEILNKKLNEITDPDKANIETAKYEQSIRKEISNTPSIKAFELINDQAGKMETIWDDFLSNPQKETLNAVDQVLINVFNKILDPNSVVRESEFARVGEGQAAVQKFLGLKGKLEKGGTGLTQRERQELVSAAILLRDKARESANEKINNFKTTIPSIPGVDKNRIFGAFGSILIPPEQNIDINQQKAENLFSGTDVPTKTIDELAKEFNF